MNATVLARSIGIRVRSCRLARGLTQRQLAELAGVSERLIRLLEAGEAPGIGLEKLALILTPLSLDLRLVDLECDGGELRQEPVAQSNEYAVLLLRTVDSWTDGGHDGE
ncbi:helix-turn-helix domain-containing protein [uncultured Adlercreutzia sp.]|uniref:helix-turn-helix domain-containing protein n=1 Tax=uncultured Adlercreutzia sp. TaxID=875803 RepID=UPI0025F5F9A3|nr:helix-turn-helix domain-containing protein [uncultured Adlercreutzia sp.]MCI9261855.1 helix-turn-helix domain-containing protein [Eggerthellaceae bacterium]